MEAYMDRLEAMSILLKAVEAGSLSGAGRALGMPLASVSRKVSELESHLGTQLLQRSARKLSLTDAGQSYVLACKRILDQVGEAERAASGEYIAPRGDLTITTPIVFGRLHVLPVVTDFLNGHPDINIRLVQADRRVDLIDESVDLAVRVGELPDSSLVALRLGTIRRVVCASTAYLAARGTPKKPSEIADHDCVSFDGLTTRDGWAFKVGKAEIHATARCRLNVNTTEAAIAAAISGVGLTRVLCYQVMEAVNAGNLVFVLRDFEPEPWPVNLVYPAQHLLPLKLRAFLDFAAPRLKAALAHAAC